MKTINLGSGITMTVPPKPVADSGEFVDVAVWKVDDEWYAAVVAETSDTDDFAKLRIPVALLEGRAVPEPAKSEPDWRGFAEFCGEYPSSIHWINVKWNNVMYRLRADSSWAVGGDPIRFRTRAEAEAALAKAKHPGESA